MCYNPFGSSYHRLVDSAPEEAWVIKAVFFDLYYTLIRFEMPWPVLQAQIARDSGVVVAPEAIQLAMAQADSFWREQIAGAEGKLSPEEKRGLYAQYQQLILHKAGIEVSLDVALKIFEKLRQYDRKVVLYDDAIPTLTRLKGRGIILGLISNYDGDMNALVHELGIASYLDFCVNSRAVGADKPDPVIFRAALERAGVKANEAIHVGDQYSSDVVGAQGVGIKALLLDRRDRMSNVTDCPRIRSLSEVVDYLE